MLAQQLLNGLVLGATYALFALGFTLIFGVLRVVNLTYGFYFSAGAFIALYLVTEFGVPVWVMLPVAALLTGLLAVAIDTALLSRLARMKAPELASLTVTLGAVLALYAATTAWLGSANRRFPIGLLGGSAIDLGIVRIRLTQLLILGAAFGLTGLLFLLMRRSRFGLALRALAENPDAARLMGVDPLVTTMSLSFLSGALGGAAGILIALNVNAIQPFMGEAMMLKGFAVVIVGGLGDLTGALVAGLALGMLEAMTAAYLSSGYKDAVAFALLVGTLWLRPSGLFGRTTLRRA